MQIACFALLLASLVPQAADPTPPMPPVDGGSDDGGFWTTAGDEAETVETQPNSGVVNQDDGQQPGLAVGSAGCPGADGLLGTEVELSFCPAPEAAEPVLTIGDVRSAFARLDLPAATLVIQPPDGLTLVNFDTNFYTTSTKPITRTVTLLGQRVTIEATPAEFHWDFGDDGALTTTEPGAPYPDLTVTHNYLQTGSYRPSLATTFTGRFRVGGGPWRQIPGTVTIDGPTQPLRAIEAQPKLVGY